MADYRYDFTTDDVLIRKLDGNSTYEILHKGDKSWQLLRPRPDYKDEDYCRALFLGQGCWEDLKQISEEDCAKILMNWGYSDNPTCECDDEC